MGNKRIFIGLNNPAGVCSRLKLGFEKIGIKSDFYSFDKHIFDYDADKIISYSRNPLIRKFQKLIFLTKLIFRYDYFIFVHPESLLTNFRDIRLLKFFGKKSMMVFTGCDVRIPEIVEKYEWNTCADCTEEYKNFVNCVIPVKLKYTQEIIGLFDLISCPVEAAGNLKGSYYPGYFPIDLDKFPKELYENYRYHTPLRIIHAPTHETYKGSKYIYKAIEKLKLKYDVEFKVIKNLSIKDFYTEIGNADLVIDQMLLGSYGFVSIEAMAMFKPVITYMRNDIWSKISNVCPIINANPNNLYEVLEAIVTNPEQLLKISKSCRQYVEDYWEQKKVAQDYYDLFLNL